VLRASCRRRKLSCATELISTPQSARLKAETVRGKAVGMHLALKAMRYLFLLQEFFSARCHIPLAFT
jgi:hypothetical protein